MARAVYEDPSHLTAEGPRGYKPGRSAHNSRTIDEIAAHLAAASRLASKQPDAELHYLLSDALMYVGQQISELDGQPANGSSAD